MSYAGRNGWRSGEWLVRDDESGHVVHSGDVVRRWDGMIVRASEDEPPHPQWFVRAKADPYPVPFTRPTDPVGHVCRTMGPFYPGTSTRRPTGAASHLTVAEKIGDMEVGCSFTVF